MEKDAFWGILIAATVVAVLTGYYFANRALQHDKILRQVPAASAEKSW